MSWVWLVGGLVLVGVGSAGLGWVVVWVVGGLWVGFGLGDRVGLGMLVWLGCSAVLVWVGG